MGQVAGKVQGSSAPTKVCMLQNSVRTHRTQLVVRRLMGRACQKMWFISVKEKKEGCCRCALHTFGHLDEVKR